MTQKHAASQAHATDIAKPVIQTMTAFHLYRAWSSANPIFTRLCEGRFNITRREWRILATAVHRGGLTSTELASAASLDPARTSRAIGSLCEKGWLRRQRAQGDARTVHVFVTPEGAALYAAMMPEISRLNALITQDLSTAELELLHTLLDKISARASQLYNDDLITAPPHRGYAKTRGRPA
jgi:DNA-binding MarR family transcriptional regulator